MIRRPGQPKKSDVHRGAREGQNNLTGALENRLVGVNIRNLQMRSEIQIFNQRHDKSSEINLLRDSLSHLQNYSMTDFFIIIIYTGNKVTASGINFQM